mmetsp:Transcript_43005/g.79945  ORF Transcript_43005/g.79945 Transcript_43005/m.79945 type:complete len:382 (-) Transcript_43005:57-1202(-)
MKCMFPHTFIIVCLVLYVSATELHCKSNVNDPNTLKDTYEVFRDGTDLPEEMTSTHGDSALQVGTQLHIKSSESVRDFIDANEALWSALWSGTDLPEELMSTLHEQLHQQHHPNWTFSASTRHRYTVLGAFDSGTNLFYAMANLNFGIAQSRAEIWKHSTVGASAIIEAMARRAEAAGEQLSDVVLVLMVRSPISQVVSWKKATYNLENCMERPFADMGHPCTAGTNNIEDEGHSQTFSSTMDVYNTYLQQYHDLKKAGAFKHVFMFTYEDLVLNPKKVLHAFGRKCGATILPPSIVPFVVMEAPAKEHGDAVGREEALQKLASRSWMDSFSSDKAGLVTLCKDLNRSLIKDLVEGAYRDAGKQVPYSHDCGTLAMLGEQT